MSNNVRAALETALKEFDPAMATAWENVKFVPPVAGTPYQRATLLLAAPDNREYGPGYIEQGIFQVSLFYPLQEGSAPAATRAQLLRNTFYRGASFSHSGRVVNIIRTPEISTGVPDGDRWMVTVKIRFSSYTPS